VKAVNIGWAKQEYFRGDDEIFDAMSKIRIGMIGCGGIARHHMRQLAPIPDAEIVALCDPSVPMIELVHHEFPHTRELRVFNDYREMLESVEMDAVQISTPHTQHLAQMEDSFARGLHVLCEKPLATTVVDAHKAIRARDASGKVGLLAYQRHTQAEFKFIKKAIDGGEFGVPTFITALQSQEWKKATAGSWRQDPALSGGGQINDSGSHLIDIILWTTGLRAESVACFSDNCGTPVDINSTVSIRFEGGAMASLSVVGDAPAWHEDITIWCERGAFFMRNGKLTVQDADGARFSAEGLRGGNNPDVNFVNAILDREEVLSPFECGLRVIELTEAAWRSAAQNGTPVQVE